MPVPTHAPQVKDVLQRVPPPYVHLHPASPPAAPPQPPPPPSFSPGAGADYALTEITDTLSRIRCGLCADRDHGHAVQDQVRASWAALPGSCAGALQGASARTLQV